MLTSEGRIQYMYSMNAKNNKKKYVLNKLTLQNIVCTVYV